MLKRYFPLAALACALFMASTAEAQNREVTGTTDANATYVQQPPITVNGASRVYYTNDATTLFIYYAPSGTTYDNGGTPISTNANAWVIATSLYAGTSTPINTLLYGLASSATVAPTGNYARTTGASAGGATVTDTALPVELTSFTATTAGPTVRLNWTTASETNNAGFSVEMKQGASFVEKGFVAGQGTTLEAQRYSYDAGTLVPGTYTFRLRQVDFDGAFEYSPEVEVVVALTEAFSFSAPHPNPMRSATRVNVSVQQTQPVTVQVFDMLGRQVATLYDGVLGAGENKELVLERGTLSSGLYLIQLQGSRVQSTRQVTIL